jgi:hypothetical protein
MRLLFGELRPDLPSLANAEGLIRARNMIPQVGGYRPASGLSALTGATALDARPRGAISGIDAGGDGFLFAGDATKLYRQGDAGTVDVSRTAGGAYLLGTDHRWSFTKFGESIYASTPNDDTQFFNIGASTNFGPVTGAPRARHLAVVGDFVMMGNIYDPVLGPLPEDLRWSAYRNGQYWPTPGTDEAVSVQSDRQPLEGGGGWVQDLVSGAEVGAAFQERAIHRLDYVGGTGVFRVTRVDQNIGMFVAHSGVAFGRGVFFIAEDGFRIFDYTSSMPIGKGKISSTFLADLDGAHLDRVWTAKDPDETVIWCAYPGAGNTAGRPNKMIWYDYALNRFSEGAIDLESLIENVTETPGSIDADESLPDDPDDLGDPGFENPGGTAGYGDTSFDDRGTAAGASRMGAFGTTFVASDFSGAALEGLIETGDLELQPGKFAFLTEARPIVDTREAEIAVATRSKRTDDITFGPFVGQDEDGKVPLRADGRYHRLRAKLPAGWTDAVGVDLTHVESGER